MSVTTRTSTRRVDDPLKHFTNTSFTNCAQQALFATKRQQGEESLRVTTSHPRYLNHRLSPHRYSPQRVPPVPPPLPPLSRGRPRQCRRADSDAIRRCRLAKAERNACVCGGVGESHLERVDTGVVLVTTAHSAGLDERLLDELDANRTPARDDPFDDGCDRWRHLCLLARLPPLVVLRVLHLHHRKDRPHVRLRSRSPSPADSHVCLMFAARRCSRRAPAPT